MIMRIRVSHTTSYCYDTPPTSVTQILRLTPRNHNGQYVVGWRIELSEDCLLHKHEDAFGNITHSFTAEGPYNGLSIAVEGEVDTHDTNSVVRGAIERFPPSLFLRETALTQPDGAIIDFANSVRGSAGGEMLPLLHSLNSTLNREIIFDSNATHAATTAAETFGLRRGVCQDLTHIFIAAARHLDIPTRYIGGHFYRADGVTAQEAGHAWAESYVEHLGWVGFDPANGIGTTQAHVRVSVGLDYLTAAPVRGVRYGGDSETLKVVVNVDQASRQTQSLERFPDQ
jgi:transglutaminase-like putative cysteine protease